MLSVSVGICFQDPSVWHCYEYSISLRSKACLVDDHTLLLHSVACCNFSSLLKESVMLALAPFVAFLFF